MPMPIITRRIATVWLGIPLNSLSYGDRYGVTDESGTNKTYFGKVERAELHSANEALKPILVKESNAFHNEGK